MPLPARLLIGVVATGACLGASLSATTARAADRAVDRSTGDDDTIEVRGDRRDLSRAPKDASVAGAVIERADLASPGVRIGEILRAQAGLQTTELGGAGAPVTASIRGATAAETPVYLGGIRMNDEVGGAADLSRIPLWIVQRIEIYRGHAPFEADRLGIGGAIFFEPRRARDTSVGGGATIGSWGSRGAFAWGTIGDEHAGLLVGVQIDRSDNDYPFTNHHGTLLAPTGSEIDTLQNADV
ncbi:MAG: TonB-dependent receptor, partial [Polyangiales bacterium]